jgi:ribosomal protein L11 methyltransferase
MAEELLLQAGASAVTLESLAGEVVLEPDPGAVPLWSSIRLKALFPLDTDVPSLRKVLTQIDPNIHQHLEVDFIGEEDWQLRMLNHAVNAQFGGRLWLQPKSLEGNGLARLDNDQIYLFLEPGLAFGSGSHPTTRMCLEWIASHLKPGQRVMDFGCGSGILAIGAALLGGDVVAVDHDDQAVLATDENAQFNNVGDKIAALSLRQWQQQPKSKRAEYLGAFDLLAANILAAPLISLADEFVSLLAPKGHLVLSGVLAEQADEVMAAYPSMQFAEPIIEEQWACLVGTFF